MGTNYYVKAHNCPFCSRFDEIHIGKSSIGWKPLLHANQYKYYKNWEEMKEWLKDQKIYDEYDRQIDYDKFVNFFEEKQKDPKNLEHLPEHFIDGDKKIDGWDFLNHYFS